jgi:hypothetical protein
MPQLPQIDPGELPNNMRFEQALRLGLVPAVTADGTPDILSDTGTTVESFNIASKQVAEVLSRAE